jgi:hypothetical protein
MGLFGWLTGQPRVARPSIVGCAACDPPEDAPLDEVAADPKTARYLCRCRACGQYWGGHAHTPHYWWALSPAEAAAFFPSAFLPKAPGHG